MSVFDRHLLHVSWLPLFAAIPDKLRNTVPKHITPMGGALNLRMELSIYVFVRVGLALKNG